MAENIVQNNDLILNRAKAAVLSRDFTLAARLYKGLLRNDPENSTLLNELGSLFIKSNQDERALPLYKEIVRLNPRDINAYNCLGGIYRRLKKYEESIAMLEQALVVDESNIQVYYNLGCTYKLMGKYTDAIQCFQTVVDENPNDVLAFNHMGSIYSLTNQNEQAVATYQRGLKIDPNHPILHLNLAKSFEALGKYDKAEQEYEAALRSKPGWLDAIDGYADLLLRKNKTKDAGDLVKQALRLNPKNAKMHTKMGAVYAKQSIFDDAETEYIGALEVDPKSERALSGLADVYEADGKVPDAVRVMKRFEALKPADGSMLKQYAHILLTANKFNAASRKIKAVWDQNPDDVQTLNLLGQYYICKGDVKKSLGCFKKIEEIDPSYTQHYRDGAFRYHQLGQFTKAEKYFLKYLESSPNDPIGLSLLAADYEDLNRYTEALDYYRKSVAADKDNRLYQQGIERLNSKLTAPASPSQQTPAVPQKPEDLNADFATDNSLEIKMDGKDTEFEPSADDDIAPEAEKTEEEDESDDKDGSFDFQSLAEQDTKPEDVLNPEFYAENAEDANNVEEEDEDLDNLIPEDDPLDSGEDNFFDNNPFGSKGNASDNAPLEDEMEPAFEGEDLDDSAKKNDKPLSFDNDEEDDEEGVADDAFDEPKKQSAKKPASDKKEHEEEHEEDEPPVEEDDVPQEELPSFDTDDDVLPEEAEPESPEPLFEDDDSAPTDSEPLEEEVPLADDVPQEETVPAEAMTPAEPEPDEPEEIPEAEEFASPEESPEPENAGEQEEAAEPEEIPEAEELPEPEKIPEAEDIPEPEEIPAEEPPETESDANFEDEQILSADAEPVVLSEPVVPDIPIEDIMSSPSEKDITPEELDESIPQPDSELPADMSYRPSNEDLFNKAAESLPEIVDAIVDKSVIEKYSLTADMFEKLRTLSNYLPAESKKTFLASKTHLLLDYIIARLNGKPGLLATAGALRKAWNMNDGIPAELSGQNLTEQVFSYMRSLIHELPDKNIAASLDGAVVQTLAKMR